METQTRGKGTIDRGLRGSVGTLDDANPTRLSKRSQGCPLTETVEIVVEGVDLLEQVRQSKVKDDKVIKVVEEMKRARVKMLRDEEWREVDGIMYKEEKVYVPKDNKLRTEIIRLYHNMPVGGHEGQ